MQYRRRTSSASSLFGQVRALFWKNLTFQWRQRCTNCCQVVCPLLLIGALGLMQVLLLHFLGNALSSASSEVLDADRFSSNLTEGSACVNVTVDNGTLLACSNWDHLMVSSASPALAERVGGLDDTGHGSGLLGALAQYQTRMDLPSEVLSAYDNRTWVLSPFFQPVGSSRRIDSEWRGYLLEGRDRHLSGRKQVRLSYEMPTGSLQFRQLDLTPGAPALSLVMQTSGDADVDVITDLSGANQRQLYQTWLANAFLAQYLNATVGASALLPQLVSITEVLAAYLILPITLKDFATLQGIFMIPLALSFLLPVYIYALTTERQTRLLEMMKINGLKLGTYWSVMFVWNYALYVLVAVLVVVLGAAFQLEFFVSVSPLLYGLLFLLWGLCQVSLGFFVSSLPWIGSRQRAAFLAGFAISILSVIAGAQLSFNWWKNHRANPLFLLWPPVALCRGIYILAISLVDPDSDGAAGLAYLLPTHEFFVVLAFLLVTAIVYLLLGFYLELVVPREQGVNLKPWFPVTWLYRRLRQLVLRIAGRSPAPAAASWSAHHHHHGGGGGGGYRRLSDAGGDGHQPLLSPATPVATTTTTTTTTTTASAASRAAALAAATASSTQLPAGSSIDVLAPSDDDGVSSTVVDAPDDLHGEQEEDQDCVEERARVRDPSVELLLRIVDLRKVYGGASKKVALQRFCLGIARGECFGLLGPNGAGKTTMISALCGLHKPTSGDAVIDGWSILSDMRKVHQVIGLCPQHDILWEDLTVDEHIYFYSRLRGIARSDEKAAVHEAMRAVGLFDAARRKVSQLSGGMKRRLSIAIALVGNPSLVLCDEPTTGLDPESRRFVWSIIEREKQGRSILLTTHNMEEADVLCSRIGIMSRGALACIGSQQYLKNRFGKGYRFTVTARAPEHIDGIDNYVHRMFPTATLESAFSGVMAYQIARDDHIDFANLFTEMKANKEVHGIVEWAISQTSLEEVFLKIVADQEGSSVS